MASEIFRFSNRQGHLLVGRLDTPDDGEVKAYAVFGHCFTCTRNLTAIGHITRGLNAQGYGVARFDFTGLGDSEGDFSDTNFTSNVEDLLDAVEHVRDSLEAPRILVGHSFGGTASLVAAREIKELAGVVAIAAPSEPRHLMQHFSSGVHERLQNEGEAEVVIGGRSFTLRRQFWEDVHNVRVLEILKDLTCAKLILHSPKDETVPIRNAGEIFEACRHPKSFVALDGADHLLSNRKDAQNTGELIGIWARRYLP